MTEKQLDLEIIGYDSGWGCRDYGCEDGPHKVDAARLMHLLRTAGINPLWRGPLALKFLGKHDELDSKEKTLPVVTECLRRLSNHTRHATEEGRLPLVIGGDHSSAIGTWSGVIAARKCAKQFGLIWIDAHMDSHTHETSYQGKFGGWWHGQPVAALMGYGHPSLLGIGGLGAKILPEHFSIIGAHSFEPAEEEFITRHKIRVFYYDEVMSRGFDACFAEALVRATTGTKGFGISFDLDAIDPAEAPGVGALEKKGLPSAAVLPIIKSIARHPLFCGLEIAEFNPHRDIGDKTLHLLEKLVKTAFTKD